MSPLLMQTKEKDKERVNETIIPAKGKRKRGSRNGYWWIFNGLILRHKGGLNGSLKWSLKLGVEGGLQRYSK